MLVLGVVLLLLVDLVLDRCHLPLVLHVLLPLEEPHVDKASVELLFQLYHPSGLSSLLLCDEELLYVFYLKVLLFHLLCASVTI